MARTKKGDLLARRAELMHALERLMDEVDTFPRPTLAERILKLSAEVDRLDRKISAQRRREGKAAERDAELSAQRVAELNADATPAA